MDGAPKGYPSYNGKGLPPPARPRPLGAVIMGAQVLVPFVHTAYDCLTEKHPLWANMGLLHTFIVE